MRNPSWLTVYRHIENALQLHFINNCQHDDINIVTVSVATRRWTASLKPRRRFLHSSKTRFTQGRLFYSQCPLFCAIGPLFRALVREEAIFAVCKRCANEGCARMCQENIISLISEIMFSATDKPLHYFLLLTDNRAEDVSSYVIINKNWAYSFAQTMLVIVLIWSDGNFYSYSCYSILQFNTFIYFCIPIPVGI